MIPAAFITEWANTVAWPTVEQVEQDLILSRLIIEIANDNYLGEELVFRGGTCLHKLRLDPALRYSEDLDYVRRSAGSISEIIDAIRTIANRLGMSVSTRIATNPKIRLRAPFESGSGTMSVKIEVNTYERSPAMGLLGGLKTLRVPAILNGAAMAVVLVISGFWSAPAHGKLAEGFDQSVHQQLMTANLIRSLAWSICGVCAIWILLSAPATANATATRD